MEKKMKRLCKCEHCGNEAEMVVTCSLPDPEPQSLAGASKKEKVQSGEKVKGTATCTHCGSEADMWIDL